MLAREYHITQVMLSLLNFLVFKILRNPQSKLRRTMSSLQQVVLQRSRQHFFLTHRQSSSTSTTQGGSATPELISRGHCLGVLQLRDEECLPTGLHTGKIGYRGSPSLPPALCLDAFF